MVVERKSATPCQRPSRPCADRFRARSGQVGGEAQAGDDDVPGSRRGGRGVALDDLAEGVSGIHLRCTGAFDAHELSDVDAGRAARVDARRRGESGAQLALVADAPGVDEGAAPVGVVEPLDPDGTPA